MNATHDQRPPATFGAEAVGGHMHHALHDRCLADFAGRQACTLAAQKLRDARATDIHALLRVLDAGTRIIGKQVGGLLRQACADVVAIGLLQPLYGFGVFQQAHLLLQRSQFGFEDGQAPLLGDDATVGDDRVTGQCAAQRADAKDQRQQAWQVRLAHWIYPHRLLP